jgi:glycine dehydrogenase
LIEPTESESKEELDRFIDALISMRKEVDEIANGEQPKDNNVFKNAPHPLSVLLEDKWDKPYSREKAVWPVKSLKKTKFWPTVGRLDDGESSILSIAHGHGADGQLLVTSTWFASAVPSRSTHK